MRTMRLRFDAWRTSRGLPSVRLLRALGGDGFHDLRLQHLLVHVGELLDVEAALAGAVLAEVAGIRHAVENECGLTRRKSDQRRIALAAALVLVVVGAEADDRRTPHLRLFAGGALDQLDERLGVGALGLVR